jgi:ribosomally synthesized peptide (two-chain TOMM family)
MNDRSNETRPSRNKVPRPSNGGHGKDASVGQNKAIGPDGGQYRTIDGQLMSFRTAWLRAVALAWSDKSFRGKLTGDDAIGAIEENFKFTWPWPKELEFHVERQTEFQWVGDDWVWPADEGKEDALTLRLPLKPKKVGKHQDEPRDDDPAIGPEERALALADYYHARPSIFGTSGGGGATPRGESLITAAAVETALPALPISDYTLTSSPIRFGGHDPPPGGFLPSAGSFTDFEVVLTAAMARAWENEAFADLLQKKTTFLAALKSIRGFTSPWKLVLKVEDDTHARWMPRRVENKKRFPSEWIGLRKHKLTLNLPKEPEINDRSIALAAYNSTGAQFPLTCCG